MSKVHGLMLVALFVVAPGIGAQETVWKYSGLSSVGSEPPFKTFAQIRRNGTTVSGHFQIPGATYMIQDAQADGERIRGKLVGDDGTSADFDLLVSKEAARGQFTLEGQQGSFDLTRTESTAEQVLGPTPQRQNLTAAQWSKDLDALVKVITSEHVAPFHFVSEVAFTRGVDRVRRLIPELSGPEVAVEFRRLAAMIGDGHTNVRLFTDRPEFPISLFWFEDGLRITESTAENRNLLGATVLRIEDMPAMEALEAMRPFSPANENEGVFREVAPALLTRPEVLRRAGIGRGTMTSWTVRDTSGRTRTVQLQPQTVADADWIKPQTEAPLWEQRREEQIWTVYWVDQQTMYVNFRGYENLARNAERLLVELDRLRPARLVIDLRDNGGGDYEKGRRLLIEPITQRPWINSRGRLFVMVGRRTFSAAMVNAVDFDAMTEALLVGEPIGEKPNSYQEVRQFTLPDSGLTVGVSTKWYAFVPDDATNEVRPDIVAPPRWDDWLSPRDSAVVRVLQMQPKPESVQAR
jgi:hypothetical protein